MILDELGAYLQTAGVGTLATTIFKHALPLEQPRLAADPPVLALIEVPGLPPTRTHDAKFEQPVIQVCVRGAPEGYAAARVKAQEAWTALDGVTNQALSGVTYLWIQALQSPFFLRRDEFARAIIVFNVRCAKAVS